MNHRSRMDIWTLCLCNYFMLNPCLYNFYVQSLRMSSLFNDRLHKLISGYSNIKDIPTDIVFFIEVLLSVNKTASCNLIFPRLLEINYDKFVRNVIGGDNIKSYHVSQCHAARNNSFDEQAKVKYNHIERIFELEQGYVAFLRLSILYDRKMSQTRRRKGKYFVKFSASDISGKELISSNWTQQTLKHLRPRGKGIKDSSRRAFAAFFEKTFNVKQNGCIDVDKWILGMRNILSRSDFSVEQLKKIFYMILYTQEKETIIAAEDLIRFFSSRGCGRIYPQIKNKFPPWKV